MRWIWRSWQLFLWNPVPAKTSTLRTTVSNCYQIFQCPPGTLISSGGPNTLDISSGGTIVRGSKFSWQLTSTKKLRGGSGLAKWDYTSVTILQGGSGASHSSSRGTRLCPALHTPQEQPHPLPQLATLHPNSQQHLHPHRATWWD